MDISSPLAKADEAILKEIIRNAESFLSAQLTSSLAANQRAMTFTGLLAGAALLIMGAAGSALTKTPIDFYLSAIGFSVGAGLLAAMVLAIKAAKPTRFWYVGNTPAGWVQDVEAGKTLQQSLAEQCSHYASMISDNDECMAKADKHLLLAMRISWASLAGGGALAGAVWILRLLCTPPQ